MRILIIEDEAKHLVELHGGRIAACGAVGKETVFEVKLRGATSGITVTPGLGARIPARRNPRTMRSVLP